MPQERSHLTRSCDITCTASQLRICAMCLSIFQKNEYAQVIFANAENGQSVKVSLEAANREKQENAYCEVQLLNTFLFPSLTITQSSNTCPTLEGNRQSRNFACGHAYSPFSCVVC